MMKAHNKPQHGAGFTNTANAFSQIFSLAFQLAWRNLFRNKRRSLVTLLAVIVGTGSTIALVSFVRGISTQLVNDSIFHLTGHIQIRTPGYQDDPVVNHRFSWPDQALKNALENIPDASWAPRVRVPGVVVSERETRPITIVGIDPELEEKLSIAGKATFKGKNLEDSSDESLIVGDRLFNKIKSELNRRVVLMTQSVDNQVADRGFRIVGGFRTTLESVETGFAFTGLATAQEMIGIPHEISEISIILEDSSKLDLTVSKLRDEFPQLAITSWLEAEPMLAAITKMQSGILYVWFGIIVFAVAMGLMNTMFMAIYERIKEIALLKAVGTPGSLVFIQVLIESTLLLILGAIFGTLSGLIGFKIIQPGIDIGAYATGAEMLGLSRIIYPQIFLSDLLTLNLFLLTLGLLGTIYPAWYASKKDPIKELQ